MGPARAHFGRFAGLALTVAAAGCQTSGGTQPAGGPVIDPAAYVGRSDSEVVAALGQPASTRSELDAEIWQYAGPDCVVDLFLYPEDGVRQVAHAEARNRTDGETLSQCAMRAG